MSMTQYYPAIFVHAAETAQDALASIGIVGADADLCLVGVELGRQTPVVFEVTVNGRERTSVVLMEREDGAIGLWFGMFQYLNETREGALRAAAEELLLGGIEETVTIDVFEWAPQERTLQ